MFLFEIHLPENASFSLFMNQLLNQLLCLLDNYSKCHFNKKKSLPSTLVTKHVHISTIAFEYFKIILMF